MDNLFLYIFLSLSSSSSSSYTQMNKVGKSVGSWNGKYDRRAFVLLCFNIAESTMFQHLVTICIVLAAFVIGFESDHEHALWMSVLTWIALLVFTIEAVVKIGSQAITPGTTSTKAVKKYFHDHWYVFFICIFIHLYICTLLCYAR
jgi:hypothetical protein